MLTKKVSNEKRRSFARKALGVSIRTTEKSTARNSGVEIEGRSSRRNQTKNKTRTKGGKKQCLVRLHIPALSDGKRSSDHWGPLGKKEEMG